MVLLAALCGSLVAVGITAAVIGWRGWPEQPSGPGLSPGKRLRARLAGLGRLDRLDRLGWSAGGAMVALVVTGWPVGAVIAAVAAWVAADALSSREHDPAEMAEAIALWTAMLRDALGTAMEIETVLRATAPTAPRLIRDEVLRATAKLDYASLDEVLDELAAGLGGAGDLVIVALRTSGSGGRQVRSVLASTARATDAEAKMLRRVAVARQSPRSAARMVTGITVVAGLGTVIFFRDWVEPYATPAGQVVLAVIAGGIGTALWWMARMTDVRLPAQFKARAGVER